MTVTLQTGNFEAFFAAPFEAYGADSPYVSPLRADLKRFLDKRQNPFFDGQSDLTYFTAHRDGRIVGRITAHVHAASNTLHGLKRGYFGYFDCANDPEAATDLLSAAEWWCAQRGLTEIAGNFNLTAMQMIGVMTDGFETAPFLDQVWSPPYLARLLEANGYAPSFPMTTFGVGVQDAPVPQMGPKQKAIADDPAFAFAPVTRRTIPQRMEEARQILNASFADNPMFVPVSHEEFHFQAKDMKWVMDPRISAVLHHNDKPAACIICVPDLNPLLHKLKSRMGITAPFHFVHHRLTNKRAVLIFIGVIPELQRLGVNPYLMSHVLPAMKKAGYESLGNTWIADVNEASLAQKDKAGATALHRLHIFGKQL